MQGQLNSDLTDRGREQVRVNGELLTGMSIEVMFASPLGRCRQSAEIIAEQLGRTIRYDDRLMEWDCGEWSGHLYDKVVERWPTEWQAFQADRFHYRGPGCENFPDMIARTVPFLAELQELEASRIAVISHGLIGRVMASSLLQLGEQQTLSFHQDNDTVVVVSLNENGRQVSHYVGGGGPHNGLPAD